MPSHARILRAATLLSSLSLAGSTHRQADSGQRIQPLLRDTRPQTSRPGVVVRLSVLPAFVHPGPVARMDATTPTVKNLMVLDSEGKRIAVKYYSDDWPTVADQAKFEKATFPRMSKTYARAEADILMLDNCVVLYRVVQEVVFAVTGSLQENEVLLLSVLKCLTDATTAMLKGQVDKRMLLENMDLLLLVMDEIVDSGLLLETDPNEVAERAAMRGAEEQGAVGGNLGGTLTEQAVQQFVSNAKEQFRNFLRS